LFKKSLEEIMTKTVPVLLAIAISVWLLATTAINVIWLAVFLIG
jgi:hypothetical protein